MAVNRVKEEFLQRSLLRPGYVLLCGVLITLVLRKDYKNAHAAVCQWLCDVKFGLITEGARARTWVVSRLKMAATARDVS